MVVRHQQLLAKQLVEIEYHSFTLPSPVSVKMPGAGQPHLYAGSHLHAVRFGDHNLGKSDFGFRRNLKYSPELTKHKRCRLDGR
jgi:hypothetical protein